MITPPSTIRVVIPLKMKRRNGRPRILPPADSNSTPEVGQTDPRTLRAIGRAWSWRRKLERGEVATVHDIAAAEKITPTFVSRMLRLAYLSPAVLEQLLTHRRPRSPSIIDCATAALRPWAEQPSMIFED